MFTLNQDTVVESVSKYVAEFNINTEAKQKLSATPVVARAMEHRFSYIEAGTGMGKTFGVINFLKEKRVKFVFAVDSVSLATQISNEYGIELYVAATRDEKGNDYFKNKPCIVTVYNHVEAIADLQGSYDRTLIIDEAHGIVTDYGFKGGIIKRMLESAQIDYKNVIMLSGTPVTSKDEYFRKFKFFKVNDISRPVLNVKVQCWDDLYASVTREIYASVMAGRKVLVSMQAKGEELETFRSLLTDLKVATLNADTKNSENEIDFESEEYDNIVNGRNLNCDVLFTTYSDGYSLYGDNWDVFVVPSVRVKLPIIKIAQVLARPRKTVDARYIIFTNDVMDAVDYTNHLETVENDIYNGCVEIIRKHKLDRLSDRAVRRVFEQLNHKVSIKDYITEDFSINWNLIMCRKLEAISEYAWQNFETMKSLLAEYHIELTQDTFKLETETKTEMVKIESKNENLAVVIAELKNGTKVQNSVDKKLYKKIKDLTKVVTLSLDEIYEKVAEVADSPTKLGLEMDKLTYLYSVNQSVNAEIALIKEKFNGLKHKTAVQLAAFLKEVTGEELTTRNAMKKLGYIFEIAEFREKINGKDVRFYNLKLTQPKFKLKLA